MTIFFLSEFVTIFLKFIFYFLPSIALPSTFITEKLIVDGKDLEIRSEAFERRIEFRIF
jgi:hypothetical protein